MTGAGITSRINPAYVRKMDIEEEKMSDWNEADGDDPVLCIDCDQEFYLEEQDFGYCWQCKNYVCDGCIDRHLEKYCEEL
jgi:hypothetical protein